MSDLRDWENKFYANVGTQIKYGITMEKFNMYKALYKNNRHLNQNSHGHLVQAILLRIFLVTRKFENFSTNVSEKQLIGLVTTKYVCNHQDFL